MVWRGTLLIAVIGAAASQNRGHCRQVRIGAEAVVPENPRSRYSRYVNWRPADGETVHLNPPRMSWPYWPDWPESWRDELHRFRLQISSRPDCSRPVVDLSCPFNFYNTLPALKGARRWYWRVGYDVGTRREKWSDVRSFTVAGDAVRWDRSALTEPRLAERGHPRICFSEESLARIRALARTNPDSRAALRYMRRQADAIVRRPWWDEFPETDRDKEPKQAFYTIARDLATVCFVWRMTGEDKYAGVKRRAVTWASYPPGGRASPEGLGGDGSEDATQGNEFLALLFDWLYPDLTDREREVMIRSLEWRVDHVMNSFAWRAGGSRRGAMLRLTFGSDAESDRLEAEQFHLEGGARVVEHRKASGGRLVELAGAKAVLTRTVKLDAGRYVITVSGEGPSPDQDAFYVAVDDQKPQRIYISGWGDNRVDVRVPEAGEHTVKIMADPNEVGVRIDTVHISTQGERRLHLRESGEWRRFSWRVPAPTFATHVASSLIVELFNYRAAGEVWWDSVHVKTGREGKESRELVRNPDFSQAARGGPVGWRGHRYNTGSELRFDPKGGRDRTGAVVILCGDRAERGSWVQSLPLAASSGQRRRPDRENATTLFVTGWYRTAGGPMGAPVRARGLSGCISSHQFEASMDTAVCGLVLYEHSELGREWFELMLNYLIGVTCGYGFDEAWNEGAGYGTSKAKWLMNATMYFDTALPEAKLGRNPFYGRIGDWFSRIIPVGMPHHAWGNQARASRGNHLAHFRKLAHLTGQGRFLLNWQEYGGRRFSKWRPWIEYVLPAYYRTPTPEPERDPVGVFDVAGWAMAATGPPSLRSTYEKGAGVIFQCRARGGYSHSFNSDGSFQLHAYGQMLNHGGGSSANKDAYAYHTMSHNTILVDGLGQAQPGRGMLYPTYGRLVGTARGSLSSSSKRAGGPQYVYFAGDATRCYPKRPGNFRRWALPLDKVYQERALPHLQRFIRHILFLRGRYFVIYDDLACSRPASYTWLYHILPKQPFAFDGARFAVDYAVGGVEVRLQHIAHPDRLKLDDREGLKAFVNPFTGEDYRKWRLGKVLCGHNLWVTNTTPAKTWQFLTVIYPAPPGGRVPPIERIDDSTVRVGRDVISFDPASRASREADVLVDVRAMRGR